MAIIKGFNLSVIDSNDNVITSLGTVLFPALEWRQNLSNTRINIDNEDFSYFAPYTPDYGSIGNTVSDYYTTDQISQTDTTTQFGRFLILAPLTLRKETIAYGGQGYRVKLDGNSSGYYAISQNAITAQGFVTGTWYLFDSEGNQIGSANANIGFPLSDSVSIYCLMPHSMQSGLITGITCSVLRIAFQNRTTHDANISITGVTVTQNFVDWYNHLEQRKEPTTDPFEPGGNSGTGGGTGDFDGTGDDIDIPNLPTLSAADTGFITLFNPSPSQLKSLANYMWSTGFDLETFKKLFANPMDCILGLSIVPVAVPTSGSKTVNVGNISTGVSMPLASSQYVEIDCGTLNVNEFWGAYLDYDPYTQAEIYLPYIGTHPLKVDDIMGKAVHVVYHVDILSGACTAYVKCDGSVLYEFIGQCSSSIPITGNDWTNVINGVISIAGAIGSMVATGGASAPTAGGVIASTAVNSMKPNVEKSGSMSGTGGMLAVQVPYLILTRPNQALPYGQNSYMGYPSFITENLGSISGYTEIESVHLTGIPATEQELSEIESLLKSGVIL